MPALRAWGRRWLVADDDFVVVSIAPCVFHFAFLPPLIAWFALVRNPEATCAAQKEYTVAFSGILVSYFVSFCLEVWMVYLGCRGSPLDQRGTDRRRRVTQLVHLDTVSHVVQLVFVLYLSYLGGKTFKKYCYTTVPWNDDAFVWSLVGVFWTYILFYLLFLVLVWDYSGKHRHANECWDRTYMHCLWLSVLWFGWNPFSGAARRYHRERAVRFGKNMKSLFGHCDMSLTDFLLAFMNARHRARHSDVVEGGGVGWAGEGSGSGSLTACLLERGSSRVTLEDGGKGGGTATARTSAADDSDEMTVERLLSQNVFRNTCIQGALVEPEVIQDVAYYYKYALAAYGWMMYFLGRGVLPGLWALAFGGKGGYYFPMFRRKANWEIACLEIGTVRSNILFLREQGDKDNVLCYVMAVDHERKSIVLSVRGAVTVDDNVRDMLLEPGDMTGWLDAASKGSWEARPPPVELVSPADVSNGGGRGRSVAVAQGDYLEACRATLCDILDCGVLETALRDHEGYGLTFVGHSLGAVGSFFLALYFERWIPNVRCWCFSPPAGLVDASIAESPSCRSWCTSIANGKEIVPRFSAANLDRARDELVCSLASVDVPKWRRMRRLLWKWWDVYQADDDLNKPLDPNSLSDDTRTFLEDYVRSRNDDGHRRYLVEAAERMSLPGKLIYFEPKLQQKEETGANEASEANTTSGRRAKASSSSSAKGWSGPFHFELDMSISMDMSMMMPTERDYVPKYVPNAAVKNQGVILSGRLLSDHMPDYAEDVILRLKSDAQAALEKKT